VTVSLYGGGENDLFGCGLLPMAEEKMTCLIAAISLWWKRKRLVWLRLSPYGRGENDLLG